MSFLGKIIGWFCLAPSLCQVAFADDVRVTLVVGHPPALRWVGRL
jgi:hypothetical protein